MKTRYGLCLRCGKPFEAQRKTKKYCSGRCRKPVPVDTVRVPVKDRDEFARLMRVTHD